MRVRGLKRYNDILIADWYASHPVRVRGLKPMGILAVFRGFRVAPRAGAWIETLSLWGF